MSDNSIDLFDSLLFLSLIIQAEADSDRTGMNYWLKEINDKLERICDKLC